MDRDTRLRRLHMRSIRRGIKEMDLILTQFATTRLAGLSAEDLDLYEALLAENDLDIYAWICGQSLPPAPYGGLIGKIAAQAQGLTRPA
jgi:antitoxin CptB